MDGDEKGRRWLRDYAKKHDMTWTLVPATSTWYGPPFEAYDVSYLPFSVLLDRDSRVVTTDVRGKAIEKEIAKALAAAGLGAQSTTNP